ncbi:MAG: SMC family ATPase, partial [Muribaculaceae bacterium]|nr:SMC family ATPase [Muribaculaceae bacterium]
MIFKKLTIRNIATIADAEIDFNDSPLATSPLFLIYGPTGAGKTTILDGICLALYDAAPRLDILNQKKRQFEDESTNKGIRNVNDVSNLIRHGTSDAFVRLSFEGNDGRPYIASWTARFGTRGGAKGKLLDIDRSLIIENTDDIWEKKADIDKIIASSGVVGMSYNNFLRTTLLPQGAFNRFLAAGRAEKAEILEKLAGLDRFTELGEKITLKYKEVSKKRNELETEVNNLALLSDKELEDFNNDLDNKIHETAELEKKLAHNRTIIDWLEKRGVLLKSLEQAQIDFNDSLETVSNEKFLKEGQRIKLRKQLAPLRAVNAEIHQAGQILQSNKDEILNIGHERNYLSSAKTKLRSQKVKISESLILLSIKQATFKPFSSIITDHKTVINLLESHDRLQFKIIESDSKINDNIKKLTRTQSNLTELLELASKAKEIENETIAKKKKIIEELSSLSSSSYIIHKDKLKAWKNILRANALRETERSLKDTLAVRQAEYADADNHYHKLELSTLDAAESLRSALT